MGMDVYVEVEVRHKGRWWNHVVSFACTHCERFAPRECHYCRGTKKLARWNTRNYFVFAMLGVGAMCDLVAPIAPIRGLPQDVSPEVRGMAYETLEDDEGDFLSLGDHSRSWLSLRELLDYNWEAEIMDADDPPARPLRAWAGDFYTEFVPALKKLCEDKGKTPDDVRIVFGFDG